MAETQLTQKQQVQALGRKLVKGYNNPAESGAGGLIDTFNNMFNAVTDRPDGNPRTVIKINDPNVRTVFVPQPLPNTNPNTGAGLLSNMSDFDELATGPSKIDKNSPAGASATGVNFGRNTATGQNEKGIMDGLMGGVTSLLGNIDTNKLFRIMANPALQQGSMGQEANVGQNLIRRLVEANANVNQQDALAAQSGEDNNLAAFKAETDRLGDQGQTFPKPSGEITKLYQSVQASRAGLNLINQMKGSIYEMNAGVEGDLRAALVGLGSTLGYNTEVTPRQSIKQLAQHIRSQIIASGVFGRDVNKSEYKILDDLVPSVSILDAQSKNKMMSAYKLLQDKFSRQAKEGNSLLVNVYGLKPVGEVYGGNNGPNFTRQGGN